MRIKRAKREISYETYVDWKLNYSINEVFYEGKNN